MNILRLFIWKNEIIVLIPHQKTLQGQPFGYISSSVLTEPIQANDPFS